MNLEQRKKVRRDQIIEIAEECQELGPGPDAPDHILFQCIEDCIGGRTLSYGEERLVLVAYNENAETAKRSVWYTW